MHDVKIFEYHTWQPLAALGIHHPFFTLHTDTILYSWVALGILIIVAFIGRFSLAYPQSILGYLTLSFTKSFKDAIEQSFEYFNYRYFLFITTLFSFIFISNILLLFPGCEEPTKDLNTTVAFALISFFYIQKETLKTLGLWGYIQEYMKFPFSFIAVGTGKHSIFRLCTNGIIFMVNLIIGLATLPLEVLSKIATVISLSFRLFGNIFAGSMIFGLLNQAVSGSLLLQMLATFSGAILIVMVFFGIFESAIQAYVFTILSLTYLSMAVQHGEIAHVEEPLHD